MCEFNIPAGYTPTSVAVHPSGQYAVVSMKNDPSPGLLRAYSIPDCAPLWDVGAGIGPDSVAITPNGQKAVLAIEDEEAEVSDPAACPPGNTRPGRVDIVDLPQQPNGTPIVTTVPISLDSMPGVNCPNDPQPEAIAISPDSMLAYVTLQENNALATIDLGSASVLSITPLGTTSHLADTTPGEGSVVDDPFTGRREPDGIAISRDGRWLFTADEGDTARTGPCGGASTVYSGGRTMTVLRAAQVAGIDMVTPSIVGDTGSQIEMVTAASGALPDGRVCARGPEPEMVTTFLTAGGEYAAVTIERSNGVLVFNVSHPEHPAPVGFVLTGVGPESVIYLPTRNVLAVTNEVAGSITVISVGLVYATAAVS